MSRSFSFLRFLVCFHVIYVFISCWGFGLVGCTDKITIYANVTESTNISCVNITTCGTLECPCVGLNQTLTLAYSTYLQDSSVEITLIALPGTYSGPENYDLLISFPITLSSLNGTEVEIDGNKTDSRFLTITSDNVVIEGFNLFNFNLIQAMQMVFLGNASVTFNGCLWKNNYGGLITSLDSSITMYNNVFMSNSHLLNNSNLFFVFNSNFNLNDTQFYINGAVNLFWIENSSFILEDLYFSLNTLKVGFNATSSTLTMNDCSFTSQNNINNHWIAMNNSNLLLTNTQFVSQSFAKGGVISTLDSNYTISNCYFDSVSGGTGSEVYSQCTFPNGNNFGTINNTVISGSGAVNNVQTVISIFVDSCSLNISNVTVTDSYLITGQALVINHNLNYTLSINIDGFNVLNSGETDQNSPLIQINKLYYNFQFTMKNSSIIQNYASDIIFEIDSSSLIEAFDTPKFVLENLVFDSNHQSSLRVKGDTDINNSVFSNSQSSKDLQLISGNHNLYNVSFLFSKINQGGPVVDIQPTSISSFSYCNFSNIEVVGIKDQVNGGILQIFPNTVVSMNNSVVANNFLLLDGSSLNLVGGTLSINQCLFTNNYADNGGAIASSHATVFINNTIFTENKSIYGGAIYFKLNSTFLIENSLFMNNTADQEGGAVLLHDSIVKVGGINNTIPESTDSNDNEIDIYDNESMPNSNIISEFRSNKFNNVLFRNNTSQNGSGGALAIYFQSETVFQNCTFEYNNAITGGAIAVFDNAAPYFEGGEISNNFASSSGGGISIQAYSAPILNQTIIEYNVANSTGGGVKISDSANPHFISAVISYNYSPNEGGGIVLGDKSNITCDGCIIEHNKAGASGGGITFSVTSTGNITNSQINHNSAKSSGGGIVLYNSCTPYFYFTKFYNNSATEGGAISLQDTSLPYFNSCDINHNRAISQGGAILASDNSNCIVFNSTFQDNTAIKGRGGAILFQDLSTFTINATIFYNNSAENGGAIYTTSNEITYFYSSQFLLNFASIYGGAFSLASQSYLYFENLKCLNNTSSGSGGCFSLGDQSSIEIYDSDIKYNIALSNESLASGGGISAKDSSTCSLTSVYLFSNIASYGGGLSINQLAKAIVSNSTLQNNIADIGGGVYYTATTLTSKLADVLFHENYAESGGGLAFQSPLALSANTFCDNCKFLANSAVKGGGVYLSTTPYTRPGSHAYYSDHNFNEYYSNDNDNNYYEDFYDYNGELDSVDDYELADPASFNFRDAYFESNIGELGGAIFVKVSKVTAITFGPNCTLISNLALEYGGGVYIFQDLNMTESTWMYGGNFTDNNAIFAGTNVGLNALDYYDLYSFENFCSNCYFGLPNSSFTGYQNQFGWASPPSTIIYDSYCPLSSALNGSPFNISAHLEDRFGTVVNGSLVLLKHSTINLSASKDCSASASNGDSQEVNEGTGYVYFEEISLQGKNNESCEISLTSPQFVWVFPEDCSIELYGCENNMQLSVSNPYDTCIPYPTSNANIIRLLIIVILILILIIICTPILLLIVKLKQWYHNYVLEKTEVPDLINRSELTLEAILSDPKIRHIPWEEITLGERIGIGASGVVSRGSWTTRENNLVVIRDVALKELLLEVDELSDPIILNEFLNEIKLMSELKHPNIVEFYGVAMPNNNRIYLVAELMHRGSLRDVLDSKGSNIPWKLRLKFAKEIAKGVAYLHKRKVIHRDLKPHNLLVNQKWECKCSDFGISTIKESMTRTMTCIGTPIYMAPEVLSKDKYSEKADVYSFGIVLVELYTGDQPYSKGKYSGLNQAQLMFQIITNGARPETSFLPTALRQIVHDCWNLDPKLRPSFTELIVRLRRLSKLDVSINRLKTAILETRNNTRGENDDSDNNDVIKMTGSSRDYSSMSSSRVPLIAKNSVGSINSLEDFYNTPADSYIHHSVEFKLNHDDLSSSDDEEGGSVRDDSLFFNESFF